MKLNKFIPITLLALLSLVSCDPVVDPTDSTSEPDPMVIRPREKNALGDLIDGFDEGLLGDDDLDLLLDVEVLDLAYEGTNGVAIHGENGYTVAAANDPSTAYMEKYDAYGLIDGDKVEMGVEATISSAKKQGKNDYVLGDPAPLANEVMTMWKDGDKAHLTNLSEGDVEDPYSFTVSGDAEDINFEMVTAYIQYGWAYDYISMADSAYAAYVDDDSFESASKIVEATKVVDDENGDYLIFKYYAFASWFDIYSTQGAGWGLDANGNDDGTFHDYDGVYVDRGYVWGFESVIDANGYYKTTKNYNLHFMQFLYKDLNWEEGDPVPADFDDFDMEDLDLVFDKEEWGRVYGVDIFTYYCLDNVHISVPNVADYRTADATDSTYFFDVEDDLRFEVI